MCVNFSLGHIIWFSPFLWIPYWAFCPKWMAIRVCKHCRNRAAKLKWQDLMRAGKWCGSHSWLVLPPELEPFANQGSNELEPFANQGSNCAKFLGSNCGAMKFWKNFEVLTECPSLYILCIYTHNILKAAIIWAKSQAPRNNDPDPQRESSSQIHLL